MYDIIKPDPVAEKQQKLLDERFGFRHDLLRLLISKSEGFEDIEKNNLYLRFNFGLEDQEHGITLDEKTEDALTNNSRINYLHMHMGEFLGGTYYEYVNNFNDHLKYQSIGNQYLETGNLDQILNQPVIVYFPSSESTLDNEKQRYIQISENELGMFIDYVENSGLIKIDDDQTRMSGMEKRMGNVRIHEADKRVIYDLDYIDEFLNFVDDFVRKK